MLPVVEGWKKKSGAFVQEGGGDKGSVGFGVWAGEGKEHLSLEK